MRSLSRGNRKEFAIFALVIILILGVFIIGINTVIAVDKKEFTIAENTIIFDAEYNPIEIEQETKLYRKWNQNFYLKKENTEHQIGKTAINFNELRNKLSVYGNSFEVKKGGEVTKYLDQNEITRLSQDRFFKLEDRKYLVTGETIKNSTGKIETKKFLIFQLDKTGNTLITNNELNMKTISPMKIETKSFEFDVANEKLIFTEDSTKEEIDLKKIIGSSNEYIEIHPEENIELQEEKEKEKIETEQIAGAYEQKNGQDQIISTINPQNVETNQGNNNQSGNENAENSANGQIITVNPIIQTETNSSSSSNSSKQSQNINKTPLAKSVNLRGVTPRSTSIEVQYTILDTENRYQTVYLDIQGDIQKVVALDKSQKSYLVTGLTPNTEYKVTLAYKEILPNNTISDGIEDTIIVRTAKISDTLHITKIGKNKIYFTYKMDSNYVYDSGKIAVYIDGEKRDEIEIDTQSAIQQGGWKSSINCNYRSEVVLKLEGLVYEGKEITRDLQARIKLY